MTKLHGNSVHEQKKPFKCNICDADSSQKRDFESQVKSVHEEKKSLTGVILVTKLLIKSDI